VVVDRGTGIDTLAVCMPLWNRGDLFRVSLASLLRQLEGIRATLWVFDNGSDPATRAALEEAHGGSHRLCKVFLPENCGIPYVVNLFHRMVSEECELIGHRAPSFVMLADADAYFKKPVRHLLGVLHANQHVAVVSGHDSVEHADVARFDVDLPDGTRIAVREKAVERGLCLVMRREELAMFHPFPHHVAAEVDWEIALWNRRSLAVRRRKLVATDHVAHLGIYESTWSATHIPASSEQVAEIHALLDQEELWTPERRLRAEMKRAAEAAARTEPSPEA
jgi:glycosyltransferase involved in cell wall biosynthesis